MRYRRVLLVFPDYKGGHFGALRPPAGLGYIHQFLINNGIECDIIDMALEKYGEAKLIQKIEDFKPDAVGMSMMSFMYHRSYQIAEFIKEKFPDIEIVAGGPHVSTFRRETLIHCDAFDYGIIMDGEFPMYELCKGLSPEKIANLIWRKEGEVVLNPQRPWDRDMEKAPWPRYEGFPLSEYVTEEIGIETSRGCPFLCTFCPVPTTIGRKFRIRSPESLMKEIVYWYERGYRQYSILDDVFNLDEKRVYEICEAIIKLGLKDIEFNCNNGIRADRVDHALLSKMYEAGFRYLAYGVEGGNDKVLQHIKKGECMETVEKAIVAAIDIGFKVTLFFVIGSPGETLADVKDSIKIAKKYPVFDSRFYNLVPFPGSELYNYIKEKNYFLKDPENYLNDTSQWDESPVFLTPEFPYEDRMLALNLARDARREVRALSMEKALQKMFGKLSGIAAKVYVNDYVQDVLLKNKYFRRPLVRVFKRQTRKDYSLYGAGI